MCCHFHALVGAIPKWVINFGVNKVAPSVSLTLSLMLTPLALSLYRRVQGIRFYAGYRNLTTLDYSVLHMWIEIGLNAWGHVYAVKWCTHCITKSALQFIKHFVLRLWSSGNETIPMYPSWLRHACITWAACANLFASHLAPKPLLQYTHMLLRELLRL